MADLAAAIADAPAQGLAVTEPQEGPHEIRASVTGADGVPVIPYAPGG